MAWERYCEITFPILLFVAFQFSFVLSTKWKYTYALYTTTEAASSLVVTSEVYFFQNIRRILKKRYCQLRICFIIRQYVISLIAAATKKIHKPFRWFFSFDFRIVWEILRRSCRFAWVLAHQRRQPLLTFFNVWRTYINDICFFCFFSVVIHFRRESASSTD